MTASPPKILLVDDRPENLLVLNRLLRELDIELIETTSGLEALTLTLEHDFFAAIVDVQMPEMDGYELVELLRGNENTATLPILFVSAIYSDEYHHRKAYDAGAVDFLSKPFIPEVLVSKVKVFLALYRQRQQLEEVVEQLNSANEELSRFTTQLRIGARVSQQITSILDLEHLLEEVVQLIRQEPDYYFVGVWLVDAERDEIRLKASSRRPGDAGAEEFDAVVPLDTEQSIIAHVCRNGTAYLAPNVTMDALYLYRDFLPLTVSELVLPLKIGDKLLGVLDIQSEREAAFDASTKTALQIMADQIAVAIRNAGLYAAVVTLNEELENRVRARTSELERAYHQLELLDENKTKFIQVVSHELRTPLTLIKGFGQILLRNGFTEKAAPYRSQVEGIVKGADRMHEIVNSMLDMVRIDTNTLELVPEWLDLPDLLDQLVRNLAEPLTYRDITIALEPMPDFPEIFADGEALAKLFNQLLFNAIKYTPDGGSITLSGRTVNVGEDDAAGGFVEIVVSDTGIGIDPKVRDLIFVKFYQTGPVELHSSGKTKFKGGGAGLGLALAQGIAEAHGGKIWAESPGYDEETCPGSHFHVVLPVKQDQASREALSEQFGQLKTSTG